LRQAIIDANANVNAGIPDVITFDIVADGSQQKITLLTALDPISEAVLINGFSQYGVLTPSIPLIEINGAGTINDGLTFSSTSDGSVVQGLMITNFSRYGIQVDSGADGITIASNWVGTTGTGTSGDGNDTGINIQGANTIIGGAGVGNVITSNSNEGINITGSGATGTIIQGNIIGLDPDGATGSGNTDVGIALLTGSDNTIIGGTTVETRNIISNNYEGIEINSDNNLVQGNYIGTDITGLLDRGNRLDDGVEIQSSATGNLIGGSVDGAGNLIAFNARDGVYIASGSDNTVLGNEIHSNSDLGIDLGSSGVTINDTDDGDSGANNQQNFPVITSAGLSGPNLTLNGSLDTDGLNSQYRIEFFGNVAGTQDTTNGEARYYLGYTTVTTNGSGDASIANVIFPGTLLSSGDFVTATATRIVDPAQVGINDVLAYGTTSELSANRAITAAPVATDDASDYAAEVLAQTPLSYWRLGETSGAAVDVGSSTNDGAYNGGMLGQTGAINSDSDTAVRFDALSSDYIGIVHSDDYLLDNGTVQLWFNVDTAASGDLQHLFSKDSQGNDTGGHLSIYLNAGGNLEVRFQSLSASYLVTSPSAVTAGEWHHAAFSFGANGMKLYLDGDVVDTDVYTGGMLGNSEPIAIGAGTQISGDTTITPVDQFFTGLIDEIAIIGSQINAETIQDFYAAALQHYAIDEGGTLNVSATAGVLANDFDVDGDALTVVLGSDVSNGTLVLNANGSFSYTPDADWNGTDSFTYLANDGALDSNIATVTTTVNPVNDAPTVANPIDDVTVSEDAAQTLIDLSAVFADVDIATNGDSLNYSVSSSDGTLVNTSITDTTLTLTYVAEQNGTATVTITVTDTDGLVATQSFTVTVTPVNDAPTNIGLDNSTVDENSAVGTLVGHLSATDIDAGDTATYSLAVGTGDTDNASFQIVGGELQTNAVLDFETQSSYSVRLQVKDSGSETYEVVFVIGLNNLTEYSISGTVYEDVNGDSNLADQICVGAVTIHLYRDGGDGLADGADDNLVDTTATNGAGRYQFNNLIDAGYWIIVDSKTLSPSAGLNASFNQGDVWAEQSYGSSGALVADGSGGTTALGAAGAAFGGRQGDVSDNASSLASAEHVTNVSMAGSDISGVDSAFSFNVVTSIRGGDSADDDSGDNRSVQGSLRQFIANANAINGANVMRFVPTVAANATDGAGNDWWSINITSALAPITDAFTTVDGRAYRFNDGISIRDDNAGQFGSGGTVGVDNLALSQVDRPELEIVGNNSINTGISVSASDATIANLTIYGFGNTGTTGDIYLEAGASDATIQGNIIGSSAGDFTDPGAGVRTGGSHIYSAGADNAVVQNNLLGFGRSFGIFVSTGSDGWQILDNELRDNGVLHATTDGVTLNGADNAQIIGNLISGTQLGSGVDVINSTGALVQNNSIIDNGGGTQPAGLRLYGASDSTISRNIFDNNVGPGIVVQEYAVGSAVDNTISENIFTGNGGLAIDLVEGGNPGDVAVGDGITINDLGDTDDHANGLQNFPVLSSVETDGSGTISITGTLNTNGLNQVYRMELFASAVPDGSDHGEAERYLGSISVTTDGSGNVSFSENILVTVTVGEFISATATIDLDNGNYGSTSEFALNIQAVLYDVNTATVVNQSMIVSEGTSNAVLTLAELQSTDTDTTDALLIYTVGNVSNGTLTINGSAWAAVSNDSFTQQDIIDGNVLYSHNGSNTISDSFSYNVEDPAGNKLAAQTFTITITPVNDAPLINSSATVNAAENQTAVTTVSATDNDGDVPIFSISGGADQSLFSLSPGGVLSFNSGRDFENFTDNNNDGVYEVQVAANDGNLGTDVQTILVTLTNVNEAPTLVSLSNSSLDENLDTSGGTTVGSLTSSDPDAADSSSYSINGGADADRFTLSGNDLILTAGVLNFETQSSYEVTVRVTDGGGLTHDQSLTISVTDLNEAPTVATPIPNQNATEDSAFSFTFAVDTFADVDADTLTYTSDASGWLNFDAGTRTFTGTPVNANVGTTTVTVTANDGNGGTISDSFDIVIANSNDVPTVANPISDQNATEDSGFTFTFAADTFADVDADSLTYSSDAAGWLSFDAASRTFSGTPLNANVGTTTVIVTANDGNGGTISDSFDIIIANSNDVPTVANPISDQSATEDSGFTFTFAADTFADVDADSLTYSSDASGWLSFDAASRTFSGTPLNANVGTTTVIVTANDGNGGTISDSFDIVISNTNDAPIVANAITNQSATEGSAFSFTFAANTFNDLDGDTLTYTSDASGWLTFNSGTRSFSGTPLNADVGTTTVTVTANDGNSGTISDSFDIVIANTNDAPTVANPISNQSATEDSAFSFQFAADTFADVDADSLTYTSDASGWLSFNAGTRTFSGTPLNADVGTTTVTVTANDGNSGTISDSFDIVIANTNDAPTVANPISNQSATEDSGFTFTFAADTFADVDGDSLTYTSDASGWLSFNAGTRTFSGTPLNANVGTTTVTVTANDGNGGTISETFDIIIANTNDAPTVANVIPNQNATEDSSFSFTFAANTFNDLDGDSLTYTSDASGWLSFDAGTRTFNGTPVNADVGTTTVTVTANDGNGGIISETFDIIIVNTNDAPTVANPIANQNATEDNAFSFQFAANTFADVDGDTLTYTSDASGWLSFDAGTRTFSGTPVNADVGTTTVTVTANDGNGGIISETFDIVIANSNDAPTVANPISNQSATEDSSFSFTFAANTFADVDADSLTYTSDASGWLSFDAGTRTFSGTPVNADVGTTTVTVTANDGNGGTVSETFDIVIANVNNAPTFDSTPVTVATEDIAYSYTINAIDVDGNPLSITAPTLPSWLTLTDNGGGTATLTGTPTNANVGDHRVVLQVSDGYLTSDQSFSITVININDAPVTTTINLGSIIENASLLITQADLLTGSSDVDGDSLSAINLSTNTEFGTLANNMNGTWTFSAVNGDSSVYFYFEVSDGNAVQTNTARLTVTPDNNVVDPPVNESTADNSAEIDVIIETPVEPSDQEYETDTLAGEDNNSEVIGSEEDTDNLNQEQLPTSDQPGQTEEKSPLSDSSGDATEEVIYLTDEIEEELIRKDRHQKTDFEKFAVGLSQLETSYENYTLDSTFSIFAADEQVTDIESIDFDDSSFKNLLDQQEYELLREQVSDVFKEEKQTEAVKMAIISATTTTFTVGIVSYLLRAGTLATSMLTTLPLWHGFDPIAVLSGKQKRKKPESQAIDETETLFDEENDDI
jgi:parallel beta-helix repeat protein